MTTLFLDYDKRCEVTRERDTEDRWSGEDTTCDWDFNGIAFTNRVGGMAFPVDFAVAAGDVVYVVVAIWSTGDSFSRNDREEAEIFGIYTDDTAAMNYATYLEVTRRGKYDWSDPDTMKKSYPWYGYFEHLDEVRVLVRMVGV